MNRPLLSSLWLWALVALAAIFAACQSRPPSRFPHKAHLVDLECGKAGEQKCLTCVECHSPRQQDRAHKLPDESLCARCHREDAHQVAGLLTAKPERPFGSITFDHDRHLDMPEVQGQCVPCHAGVIESQEQRIPPMAKCFTCHEHQAQWQKGECAPCHGATDLSQILPQTFLRHEGQFLRIHGSLAAEQGQLCESCHAQSDCDDCHDMTQLMTIERRRPEKIDRRFVHRGDFIVRHAIEAASEPSRCVRCHEPATCDACHLQRGVSGGRIDGRNPHPPGWVSTSPGGSNFHGRDARRDIVACASCHDQGPATNCIRCHQVGGFGGNPHPGGWRSARSTDATMCRYCHE